MAKDETKRLNRGILADDEAAFNALKEITVYAPSNPNHTVAALTQAFDDMRASQSAEDQVAAAFATARDVATSTEWAAHNLVLNESLNTNRDALKARLNQSKTVET